MTASRRTRRSPGAWPRRPARPSSPGGRQDPVAWTEYLLSPDFRARPPQNWRSELLAIGSMAVLAVHLRQRGPPGSKPVGVAHDDTDDTGRAAPPYPRAP